MRTKGQGATEYLVLLAVVLIVALVSVALLGFFPQMASDAQITQSQAYWRSASPISIVESGALFRASNGFNYPYLRIRNTGNYPIRITGIVGGDNLAITTFWGGCGGSALRNISDYFNLAPGEENYFSPTFAFDTTCPKEIFAITSASTGRAVGGASSLCQNSTASPGVLDYKTLGFEYIEYIEGQQITKSRLEKTSS